MKLKIYTITTLFILLSATFSQSGYAQTVKTQAKVLTQDEIDKREVTRFVDKFMLSFEKTRDIRLIPNRFFAKGFKPYFVNIYKEMFFGEMKESETKILNTLSENELYQNFILGLNFSYLNLMIHDGICCEGDSSKFFPPKILKILNKQETRAITFFAKTSEEMPLTNINQYYELIKSMEIVNHAQSRYIKSFPPVWKKTFRKNVAETRKHFQSYRSYLCSDDDCDNQAKGTKIFEIANYPYILGVFKDNAEYKISIIFPYMN